MMIDCHSHLADAAFLEVYRFVKQLVSIKDIRHLRLILLIFVCPYKDNKFNIITI